MNTGLICFEYENVKSTKLYIGKYCSCTPILENIFSVEEDGKH